LPYNRAAGERSKDVVLGLYRAEKTERKKEKGFKKQQNIERAS